MVCRNFEWALGNLKQGKRVQRLGWNSQNQWVVKQDGYPRGIPINQNTSRATGIPEGTICKFRPYLMLKTSDESFCPWVPSISDLFAEDWEIVE